MGRGRWWLYSVIQNNVDYFIITTEYKLVSGVKCNVKRETLVSGVKCIPSDKHNMSDTRNCLDSTVHRWESHSKLYQGNRIFRAQGR